MTCKYEQVGQEEAFCCRKHMSTYLGRWCQLITSYFMDRMRVNRTKAIVLGIRLLGRVQCTKMKWPFEFERDSKDFDGDNTFLVKIALYLPTFLDT